MVGRSKKPINFWTAVRLETNSAFEFSNVGGLLNLCEAIHDKQESNALMWVEKSPLIHHGWGKYPTLYTQLILMPNISKGDMQIFRDFGYPCRYHNISRRVRKQEFKRLIL